MPAAVMLALALVGGGDEWNFRETRGIQLRYGECVVKKKHAAARTFVLTPDLEKGDMRRHLQMVGDPECLVEAAKATGGIQMRFPSDTLRYALADALVRKEFGAKPPAGLATAAPIVQPNFDPAKYVSKPGKKTKPSELEELEKERVKRLALIYLAQYGECVVRANPVQTHALILSTPDTPAESAAFANLQPSLKSCVVEGQSIKFNKVTLRGTLAMNFYRLAHSSRTQQMSAGAPN